METAELHNETGDHIFNTVGEITKSKTCSVAMPVKKEDLLAFKAQQCQQGTGQKWKRTEE